MPARLAALLCALAVAVTIVHVRGSQRAGRLSQDLTYDDVSYVADAADRLQRADAGGPARFLLDLVREPPHSPYSTALALLGLTAFGFTDSAVYWTNGLLLVATVLLLLHLFREGRPWIVASLVLLYLTGPFAGRSVTEFRPDLALGICTAAFVFALLRGALRQRPAEVTLAGVLLGVALLVKPSFFPHTVALAGVAGAILLLFRASGRPLVPSRVVLRAGLLGLLIALPHYVLHGRAILGYFWVNTGGAEGRLWSFPAERGFWRVLHHFTVDPRSAPFAFAGLDLYLFVAITAVGVAVHAARREARELLLLLGLVAAAVTSVVIVSAGRMDNEFFAATFQWLLMLAAFSTLTALLPALAPRARAAAGAAVVALHLAAVFAAPVRTWVAPPEARRGASWNDRLAGAIRADLEGRGVVEGRRVTVFVAAAAAVNGTTLRWSCQKAGFHAAVSDLHRADSEEALVAAALGADYVVVPNPARAAVLAWLPPARLLPAVLERLRASPAFVPLTAGTAADPDRYLVFANAARLAAGSRS